MTETDKQQLIRFLDTMVQLQQEHNIQVHPEWQLQAFPFGRAIWIECAELMDHYGWKWWKHQSADHEQVKLELVDIWHFGLSSLMVTHKDQTVDFVVEAISISLQQTASKERFLEVIEELAQHALSGNFSLSCFFRAMSAIEMSFESLYSIYVGKNTLNLFRQANGYKNGSYQKVWLGREDNEHLAELATSLDISSTTYISDLSVLLQTRYDKATANRPNSA